MEDKIEINEETCPCCRTKIRDEEEHKALINRLNRIEGQVRGVKGMVERDAYCIDIITQVAAITAALNAFNKELLSTHIRTCVTEDLQKGKTETAEELVAVLQRLIK
ncbi:MAG: metal-sensing transcriptional repressor [Ruminococcaceae bacterium]|nr:metal-sensing transcriptional repressor [Oscillospiraceae bacterium]